MKKVQCFLIVLFALLFSCTREQDARVDSASLSNSVAGHPQSNIACACTDTAKKTYHALVQLDSIHAGDVVKLKLLDDDSNTVNFVFLDAVNGFQSAKIKYDECGAGFLKVNVIRNGTIWGQATWNVSCIPSNFCSTSGGTDCPQP